MDGIKPTEQRHNCAEPTGRHQGVEASRGRASEQGGRGKGEPGLQISEYYPHYKKTRCMRAIASTARGSRSFETPSKRGDSLELDPVQAQRVEEGAQRLHHHEHPERAAGKHEEADDDRGRGAGLDRGQQHALLRARKGGGRRGGGEKGRRVSGRGAEAGRRVGGETGRGARAPAG
jgi:hypothetical protein